MYNKKINIALVVQNNSYPFDSRVFKEANSLKSGGFNVFVVSPRSKRDNSSFEVLNGINVYRYKDNQSKGSFFGFIFEYMTSLIKIFLYVTYLVLFKKIKIVHFANPPDFFWPLSYFIKIFGVKSIYDQHDLAPELYKMKFKNKFILKLLYLNEKLMVRSSNAIIVVNESFKNRLNEKWNIQNKKCSIIYNGPLDEFKAKENSELINEYKNKKVVLYVGLMAITDNIDFIIELAESIVINFNKKDIKFVLLGDGDIRNEMERIAKKRNLSEFIEFKGNVSQNSVMEYLYVADICIAPDMPNNLNEFLTLVKVFEYMKAEKAFVSFDLDETKRIAKDAGIYAENKEDFVNKVIYLLDNPEYSRELGKKGNKIIEDQYLWKYFDNELINTYFTLLYSDKK
jgi:glycosyltransferase involved in cell wall biosynthesis